MLRTIVVSLLSVGLACTSNDPGGTEPGSSGEGPATGAGDSSAGESSAGESGAGESSAGVVSTGGESGGSTGPGPTTGTSAEPTTTGDSTGAGAVSFTDVYEQVIVVHGCNSGYCHGDGAGGLVLTDEATSYANLVEVQANAPLCGQSARVVPGSPEASVLWYRVRPAALDAGDTCAEAHKMPKSSMGVSDSQAELVAGWISGGALE